MNYSASQLASALRQISADLSPAEEKELATRFVQFCQRKDLTYLLPKVIKHLQFWQKQTRTQDKITIISPYKLNSAMLKQIVAHHKLPGDKPIDNQVDPQLIGGYKLIHAHKVYDASVYNNIQLLKNKLIHT